VRYYPHIYFGEKSAFKAVRDTGKPGLNTRREFTHLVFVQLLDIYDKKTRDHYNRKIKFTLKK